MPIENRSVLRRTMLIPRCMTLQPILPGVLPPLSANPRNPPSLPLSTRCPLPSGPLSSPLLSSPPFPLLSASTALIHRHREGCSAARTREHRPSDFQPRRATLSSLFSRFCIHPDTPFTPLDAPTHPFVSSQDSSRGPEPRRIRSCLDASRILRLSCPNIKPLFAPCSASPVPRIIIE